MSLESENFPLPELSDQLSTCSVTIESPSGVTSRCAIGDSEEMTVHFALARAIMGHLDDPTQFAAGLICFLDNHNLLKPFGLDTSKTKAKALNGLLEAAAKYVDLYEDRDDIVRG